MNHACLTTIGVATLTGAITLAAHTPSPRPQAPAQPSTPAAQVTVTGCLKTWTSSMRMGSEPSSRPGEPTSRPSDTMAAPADRPAAGGDTAATTRTRYLLVVTESDKISESPTPASTPATNPASPAHPKAAQYVVTADAGVNLAAHVNHTIRVTGTVEQTRAATSADHAAGSRPLPGTVEGSHHAWSTLSATSVTMVSAICTDKS
jgi:hypothetical protein